MLPKGTIVITMLRKYLPTEMVRFSLAIAFQIPNETISFHAVYIMFVELIDK
jgi:hypothetical protein